MTDPSQSNSDDPYMVGPDIRVGSEHMETPVDGDSMCNVCGIVQAPTADREYHPEAYVIEHPTHWQQLTPKQARRLLNQWTAFGSAYLTYTQDIDDASTGSVADFLNQHIAYIEAQKLAFIYVASLVSFGILRPTEVMPGFDFLWENWPGNIEAEYPLPETEH